MVVELAVAGFASRIALDQSEGTEESMDLDRIAAAELGVELAVEIGKYAVENILAEPVEMSWADPWNRHWHKTAVQDYADTRQREVVRFEAAYWMRMDLVMIVLVAA